jgi:LPXTG-motif cell wall-anchored protein
MSWKYLYGATVGVFAISMVTVEPAFAQRRDGNLLPQENSGQVVAVGCLARGDSVRGGKKNSYVLSRVKRGPVESVPEGSCTADPGGDALTIDNPEKGNITDAALGRWVEIGGRLERETDKNPDNLRELDVATFKLVRVELPPRPAPQPTAAPVPDSPPALRAQAPATPAAPPPAPPAEPQRILPKTASQTPAIGLAGLVLLAAALMLRSFRRRPRE